VNFCISILCELLCSIERRVLGAPDGAGDLSSGRIEDNPHLEEPSLNDFKVALWAEANDSQHCIYCFNMAYSNSTSERMEELRFRTQPSLDSSLLGLVSPPRNGTRLSQPLNSHDSRAALTRRFTTDSSRVPTIASFAGQRVGQDNQEYGPSVRYKHPFNCS
jgi:hypothetical protein